MTILKPQPATSQVKSLQCLKELSLKAGQMNRDQIPQDMILESLQIQALEQLHINHMVSKTLNYKYANQFIGQA